MSAIKVTDRAVAEVKRIMGEQKMDPNTTYLRVKVVGGGCSGFQTKLELTEDYNEGKDLLQEMDGFRLVVDKRSDMYLEDVTLDFHEDLNVRGFKFDMPRVSGRCGCGSSFSM